MANALALALTARCEDARPSVLSSGEVTRAVGEDVALMRTGEGERTERETVCRTFNGDRGRGWTGLAARSFKRVDRTCATLLTWTLALTRGRWPSVGVLLAERRLALLSTTFVGRET